MTALWVVFGGLGGAIVGSFLATLVLRWPQDRGMGGRSACDGCHATLGPAELVPMLSFAVQRGACRRCGSPIDPTHVAIELACTLIGVVALAAAPGPAGLAGALFGWVLVALAALDFAQFWLPDRLTGTLALMGVAAGLADMAPSLQDRLIGGATGYASLALIAYGYRLIRRREGMGQGDPKLLGAIGLWLGWQLLPFVLLGASLAGLAGVVMMRLRGTAVAADTQLPLGALMALAAFPIWVVSQ